MSAVLEDTTNTVIAELRSVFKGDLLAPDDPRYDSARQVYNAMIDRHPALIARCADADDVAAAVKSARKHDMTVTVRGGGHNAAGSSVWDDALVIDLGEMRNVLVDKAAQTIRAEGGCTWADVDRAGHPQGLSVPSGFIASTGVGGLTLGGGLGYLTRGCGLTIDNLLEVAIVLADGSKVTANAEEHSDLYWAVRGGGGNFGVVTSFLFRAHPVTNVYGGPMLWPIERSMEIMRVFDDMIEHAPDALGGFFAFLTVPPVDPFPAEWQMHKVCGVVWCYDGPPAEAEKLLAPVRAMGPIIDFTGPIPWPAMQSMFDPLYPAGMQWYWKADFFGALTETTMALHAKYGEQLPTPFSTMHLYPVNGKAGRVAADATAWSYRDAKYGAVMVGVNPDPAANEQMTAWARDYWLALHPYSLGGAYVNMMMEEGDERVRDAYRGNYARLAKIKARYDPTNFFHVNQNIQPA